jgi:penicillin-binding protein 1C
MWYLGRNATGEGRPTLTGVTSAAPILFDVLIYCLNNDGLIRQLRDLEEVGVQFKRSFGQRRLSKIKQLVRKEKRFVRITKRCIWINHCNFK